MVHQKSENHDECQSLFPRVHCLEEKCDLFFFNGSKPLIEYQNSLQLKSRVATISQLSDLLPSIKLYTKNVYFPVCSVLNWRGQENTVH